MMIYIFRYIYIYLHIFTYIYIVFYNYEAATVVKLGNCITSIFKDA